MTTKRRLFRTAALWWAALLFVCIPLASAAPASKLCDSPIYARTHPAMCGGSIGAPGAFPGTGGGGGAGGGGGLLGTIGRVVGGLTGGIL